MSSHIDWKPSINLGSIVPKYYRGNTNKNYTNQSEYTSVFGTARPMKGYRKQLVGHSEFSAGTFTSSGYGVTLEQLGKPGGTVNVGLTDESNCAACEIDYSNCLIEGPTGCEKYGSKPSVSVVKLIKGWEIEESITTNQAKFTDLESNIFDQCTACNPETNVIKRITRPPRIHHDDNYTGYAQYLQSRNKTQTTNTTTQKYPGVVYINANTGEPMNPNDLPLGPQTFASYQKTICENDKPFPVIYKPNNSSFGVQGAVDAGVITSKLIQDTLSVNGGAYATADGAKGANGGRYYNSTETSNTIKIAPTPSLRFTFTKLNKRYIGSTPCCS
jgi:hypothetical protein